MRRSAFLLVCLTTLLPTGCERSTPETAPAASVAPRIAATNSYLETAVLDLSENREPVLRLADPGMCPGHFDIRPSQVNSLRRCRLLLRFDFQASLDSRLSNLSDGGLKIREIRVPGGLCEPSSYLSVCRQVADALVAEQFADRTGVDQRLAAINSRVEARTAWCHDQIVKAGWSGRSVVCSGHQEAFCTWLGLKVAATFSGPDSAAIGDLERAIRAGESAGVGVVIANLPEGRRMADALGGRLNARVVVFGNFPMMQGDDPPFDELLTSNVKALVGAARQ